MKTAKVIPIFKSGDRLNFFNYRPISLLPQFSKILEKIFNKRLMSFIENHHILTDGQYGFRSNHSTSLALTEFVEKVTSAIDKQESTIKLQDLITHRTMVMLYKANNHCLEGRLQAFFEPTAAVHKHDTRQSKLFYVKKANTTHRLLSITVRGIHVWNGLASNIRQLPSLQQFKKSLKSTLLSSYL